MMHQTRLTRRTCMSEENLGLLLPYKTLYSAEIGTSDVGPRMNTQLRQEFLQCGPKTSLSHRLRHIFNLLNDFQKPVLKKYREWY